ncbi:hypothetical protein [Bradyrhizobium sp. CCBAU 53415]|uniref:hypothetical protein n=1 Tax=Bradyrhizobium sp. CCBAU 53415 TaxID=1325119 RepID=UPI002305392F|nr:hypothetical protein [Bradyrhizobium sp. CCBAU 53415]MDA9465229.1 hypothetical protein [Bradyrhizobium sp. CCBAU 53415]
MRCFFVAVLAILTASCIGASASDTTIPCAGPPDKGASVAVHPGSQVSKTQDRQSGTCVFSINGAVATSPPAGQVLEAINFVRKPDKPMLRDPKGLAVALASLMAASAPVNQVPDELISALIRSSERVSACARGFFSSNDGKFNQPDQGKDDPITCAAAPTYSDERGKHEILERGEIAAGLPTLAISATWGSGRFVSTVYLPIVTPGQPPISAQ